MNIKTTEYISSLHDHFNLVFIVFYIYHGIQCQTCRLPSWCHSRPWAFSAAALPPWSSCIPQLCLQPPVGPQGFPQCDVLKHNIHCVKQMSINTQTSCECQSTLLSELAQNLEHINFLWQLNDSRQLSLFTGSDANYTIMASQMLLLQFLNVNTRNIFKIKTKNIFKKTLYWTSVSGVYLWTSQVQEWQRQPQQSRWHSASGWCWSYGASGARFWWGQTCDLHDTSRSKSRRLTIP